MASIISGCTLTGPGINSVGAFFIGTPSFLKDFGSWSAISIIYQGFWLKNEKIAKK
jgi:hypothetical protein